MSRKRKSYPSETRVIQIPSAHYENHPTETILDVLTHGEMEAQGLLPWSTNYTFLAVVAKDGLEFLAVYKPCGGERPLWDFPSGTLCKREYAAYRVSLSLGWDLVPPTVLREGPHGQGSVQFYVDCDPEQHYFTLKGSHQEEFKRMAVFDALLNNTDRKGGHCLVDRNGKIWAIDHGVTFHCDPKLRTVIWDYAGQPIPRQLLNDLRTFERALARGEGIAQELGALLSLEEIEALRGRTDELIKTARFPEPNSDWYTVPWPPV